MNEERIWYLLSLSLSGEANAEEKAELQTLLRGHPDAGLRAAVLQNIWQSGDTGNTSLEAPSFDKHLQRLSTHLSEPVLQFEVAEAGNALPAPRRAVRRLKYWGWAAGIAAAATLAAVLLFPAKGPHMVSNTVSTKAGSKSRVQLPDGTQVWLNADSRLRYNQDFMGTTREVHLTGEAYFDVVKDKSRPFIIHTGAIDVRVLGTSFNIRAYPNEKTTETALIQGAVEITLHDSPDKNVVLKPSEKLIVQNPTPADVAEPKAETDSGDGMLTLARIRYGKTDSTGSIETMWVRNKLAFENETFERITAEMERWYNVKFDIRKESLKQVRLTGIFENKSLAEVMEALRLSASFQYQLREGVVTVW
ncbi:MAG: FecR family protein [Bacteroidetes bacterium]|nr:FecR family protein [Bacteroidota bacterium]